VRRLSTCAHPSSLPGVCLAGGIAQRKSSRARHRDCFSRVLVNFGGRARARGPELNTFADRPRYFRRRLLFSPHSACSQALVCRWIPLRRDNAGPSSRVYLLQLTRSRGSSFTSGGADIAYFCHVIAARFNDARSAGYFSTCSEKLRVNTRLRSTSMGVR